MTGQNIYQAFLKQLTSDIQGKEKYSYHPLSTSQSLLIGRAPSCQIIIDSREYQGVSRRHVEIRPLNLVASDGSPLWQVCDLESSNGTYVNGRRLKGCQILETGDSIALGRSGPEFIFDCQQRVLKPTKRSPMTQKTDTGLNITQLVPILSSKEDLIQKAYLVPGIITVLLVIGLFTSIGNPDAFNFLLGTYLAGAGFYFVYRLAGKHKPWWLLIGSALATIIILNSPVLKLFILFFREILPGSIPQDSNLPFLPLFVRMFFGAGLMEELLKAIPVFAAMWLGALLDSPWRERIGVREPLDAILIATASAAGFTLLETVGQYVHIVIQESGEVVGLQLLIPRIIGSVAGHMAYSGYFGYFIGLSALKPSKRWQLLAIGYLSSSVLHALWNASTALSGALGILVLALVGVLSYMFLVGAILKARQISPTRSENFATRLGPPKF